MYITSDQRSKLAQDLFDKAIELRKAGETNIKQYEASFQEVIENVFPDTAWWNVTSCEIFMHLFEFKDPTATIIAILKGLKEDNTLDDSI